MNGNDHGVPLTFDGVEAIVGEIDECAVTEDGLALALTAKYKDSLRYVYEWGSWLTWDGVVWKPEKTLKVYDLARAVCREAAIASEKESLKSKLAQAATVAAVERLARADRQFASTPDAWNSDPMQLNTMSGVIDLATGKVLSHNRANFHTKVCGTKMSDSRPELWLSFIDRVTGGDAELQAYLQRMVGYCLTGDTREHTLFFFYGTGANGKSVFTSTIAGILGDYSKSTPVEVFTETRNEQHPCAVASLQSVRLALTQETEKTSRFAEARLKQMTGGDKLTARYMHQNFFEFSPQFKVLIAGNHKPRLSSVDEAIRRRVHLVPFAITIPGAERDPRLTEKLKAEWPAILGWAIQGCLQWQKHGLQPPKTVLDATDEYLSNEDRIGMWLRERCIMGRNYSAGSSTAFHDYKAWCENMNEQTGSQRTFTQELLTRQGIDQVHARIGNSFVGFGLKSDQPDDSNSLL
ncbi:MAG TPA: phage/plasmid primase, P4 family [Terriglobales bacterium]|jgi:putative DNA primase/helicase|nr:phage/plasmid primase, P4 family [Terriglobales bacterium]